MFPAGGMGQEMANAKEELQEMEEEDRETERQAMAASVELEKKRDAIIPGAYHVQVCANVCSLQTSVFRCVEK